MTNGPPVPKWLGLAGLCWHLLAILRFALPIGGYPDAVLADRAPALPFWVREPGLLGLFGLFFVLYRLYSVYVWADGRLAGGAVRMCMCPVPPLGVCD